MHFHNDLKGILKTHPIPCEANGKFDSILAFFNWTDYLAGTLTALALMYLADNL
jgi:hypothetical protein